MIHPLRCPHHKHYTAFGTLATGVRYKERICHFCHAGLAVWVKINGKWKAASRQTLYTKSEAK
jgi:hypothetical protein